MKKYISLIISLLVLSFIATSCKTSTGKLVSIPQSKLGATYIASYDRTFKNNYETDTEKCKDYICNKNESNTSLPTGLVLQCEVDKGSVQDGVYFTLMKDSNYDKLIMFVHGGGFVDNITGSAVSYCDEMAVKANAKVFIPLYPLIPNSGYNDGLAMITEVYELMMEEGKDIIIIGESAGGGLAVSFVQYLNEIQEKLPTKMILHSPWLDLSMSNAEIENITSKEVMAPLAYLKEAGKMWAEEASLDYYRVSPLYGNFTNMPETLIFVGEDEIFHPDIKLAYDKMVEAKSEVTLAVIEKGCHKMSLVTFLPEGEEAENIAVNFIEGKELQEEKK